MGPIYVLIHFAAAAAVAPKDYGEYHNNTVDSLLDA